MARWRCAVILVYTPPAADVIRILPRRWDHHLYVAFCRTCGPVATVDPAKYPGTPVQAGQAARNAAHDAARRHECAGGAR